MYLSRIELNEKNPKTMEAISARQKIHGAVESAFEGERKRRLWRLDFLGEKLYLLVVSENLPKDKFRSIINQFGTGKAAETKDYDTLTKKIENGGLWHFRLTANPTYAYADPSAPERRGTIRAYVTEEGQKKWLMDRAEKHGFKVVKEELAVEESRLLRFRKRKKGAESLLVTIQTTTYEGVLEITDAEKFKGLLYSGLGREKAYGMGMMTIVQAEKESKAE